MKYSLLISIGLFFLVACNRSDKTAPVISLNGAASISLIIGDSYSDAGATAQDEKDGDMTSRIEVTGSVDPDQAGTYVLTYTVSDFSGNESKTERVVYVRNTMDAYRGMYSVHDSIWGGAVSDYSENVLASTTVNDRLIFNRFANIQNAAVYCDYYTIGDQFNVPPQILVCGVPPLTRTFSTPTPGTLTGSSPIQFTMNYQIVEGMNTINGTAIYTKQ